MEPGSGGNRPTLAAGVVRLSSFNERPVQQMTRQGSVMSVEVQQVTRQASMEVPRQGSVEVPVIRCASYQVPASTAAGYVSQLGQPPPPAARSVMLRSLSPGTTLRASTPQRQQVIALDSKASLRGLWEAVAGNSNSPPARAQHGQDRSSQGHDSQDALAQAELVQAAMNERLSKLMAAMEDKIVKDNSLNSAMDERLTKCMSAIEEKIIKDRAEIVNTLVTMCSSVEQRAASKIKEACLEVSKLKSELVESGLLLSSAPESTGDVAKPCQSIAAQLENACGEIRKLRCELIDTGVLMDPMPQVDAYGENGAGAVSSADVFAGHGKQSPLVYAISTEVLKNVRADDCIRHMEEQHLALKQTLGELISRLDHVDSSVRDACEPSSSLISPLEFSALRETVNEIVKVLGQELRSQRQQRNQDYSAIANRMEGLESTVLNIEKYGSHLSRPMPSDASTDITADVESEFSPASRLLQLEERMLQMGMG